MEVIYICRKCRKTYYFEKGHGSGIACNNCGFDLTETEMGSSKWKTLLPEEKEAFKDQYARMSDTAVPEKSEDLSDGQGYSSNSFSSGTLRTIGTISIIANILLGIGVWFFVSSVSQYGVLGFVAGVAVSLSGIINGCLLTGFGEVISLLREISSKLNR